MRYRFAGNALLTALVLGATPTLADPEEQGPKVSWVKGPSNIDLGKDIARLQLLEGFQFAGADDTRGILTRMGNRPNGSELGLVVPSAEDQDWFIVFEWQPVGYVKDDEKDKIDADALLKTIQEATEEGNAWRKENSIPALHVTGWAEPPRYDSETHNLVWATLSKNEAGHLGSNYNMRLLGRSGFVSAVLVESPDKLAASKVVAHSVIKGFSFKAGSSYSEWKAGDKIAEYGLTALVAAGAGAAAVKFGLFALLAKFLAKSFKLILVLLAGLGASLLKMWNSIRGRTKSQQPPPGPPPT